MSGKHPQVVQEPVNNLVLARLMIFQSMVLHLLIISITFEKALIKLFKSER